MDLSPMSSNGSNRSSKLSELVDEREKLENERRAKLGLRKMPKLSSEGKSLKLIHHGKDKKGLINPISGNDIYQEVRKSLDAAQLGYAKVARVRHRGSRRPLNS